GMHKEDKTFVWKYANYIGNANTMRTENYGMHKDHKDLYLEIRENHCGCSEWIRRIKDETMPKNGTFLCRHVYSCSCRPIAWFVLAPLILFHTAFRLYELSLKLI